MKFFRKIKKNKTMVLAICVIIISIVYFSTQKMIDNYVFNSNGDIETEEIVSEMEVVETEKANDVGDVQIPQEETDLITGEEEELEESVTEEEATQEEKKIYVYITGEVNVPGVVILNEGSRIVDAINAAGGTTAKANTSKVNLVYVLEDGMKVNIPNNNDLKNNTDFEYITMSSGDGAESDYSSDNKEKDTGREEGSSYKKYSIVNINTATQTELETLPGIGPSLALKIITYRKENGKFSSIDEIKNVSGIGESKFESLKSYITVWLKKFYNCTNIEKIV